MSTALSVNLNKFAVLRNSRGGADPDPCAGARVCIEAGCDGITVHPRPDQRHIRHDDVLALRKLCLGRVEFNIEGNPFAAPRDGYPGLLTLAAATRPEQVTLVPDSDGQLTSDHGFVLARDSSRLAPLVADLKALGCRVSVFMDACVDDLEALPAMGVDRIELYTGPYAQAFATGAGTAAAAVCARSARAAQALGLGVNAGHDLSQANLQTFLDAVPDVREVSIGHALIGESLFDGLATTVARYLAITRRGAD